MRRIRYALCWLRWEYRREASRRPAWKGFSEMSIAVRLDHIRLDVSDIAVSEEWYRAALGLLPVVRYDTDNVVILQLAPAGLPAGVELWQERDVPPTPHRTQHVAFSVSDVPALTEHIRQLGFRIVSEPYRIGAETVAIVADPDGHLIEINDFCGRGVAEAGSAPRTG